MRFRIAVLHYVTDYALSIFFLIFLAVKHRGFELSAAFLKSEETPKQKPLHFITGYRFCGYLKRNPLLDQNL